LPVQRRVWHERATEVVQTVREGRAVGGPKRVGPC
jgi:hypothetical protein